MRWVFGVALLPFLACGGMCIGGMALAWFGIRHANATTTADDELREPADHAPGDQ